MMTRGQLEPSKSRTDLRKWKFGGKCRGGYSGKTEKSCKMETGSSGFKGATGKDLDQF